MKPLAYLHLSCLLLLSAACLAQDGIKTQYAPIQQDSCPQGSDRMYLFFEGEPIDYNYKKLGIVEAEADNSVSTWQMLNCLKYEAWNNCANAVIAITEKSKGDPRNPSTQSTHYKGIAVKIDLTKPFLDKYGKGGDTSFIKAVVGPPPAKPAKTDTWTAPAPQINMEAPPTQPSTPPKKDDSCSEGSCFYWAGVMAVAVVIGFVAAMTERE